MLGNRGSNGTVVPSFSAMTWALILAADTCAGCFSVWFAKRNLTQTHTRKDSPEGGGEIN